MKVKGFFRRRHDSLRINSAVAGLGLLLAAAPPPVQAQTDPAPEGQAAPAPSDNEGKTKPKAHRKQKTKKAEKPTPPSPAPAPAAPPSLANAAATGAGNAPLNVAGRLKQAGATSCATAIDSEAVKSMIGTTQSNTVSTWSSIGEPNKHAATVFIGQQYANNQAVPQGVTGIVASPGTTGSCDTTVVQVVQSPLPCPNVRPTLLKTGRAAGNLAGVELVQSQDANTLLMPTATNTCVLVEFHTTFRK